MMLEMTATAFISFGTPVTRGASDAANFVATRAEEARRHLESSYTFGLHRSTVFEEILAAAEAAREPDWDSYGSEPVSGETFREAYRFAESLPLGTPPPTITAEPDGHLAFEWYVSPHRTLSVSVSPEGDLHYAALLGPNKSYGTEAFLGEIPRTILDLVRRVHSA